MLYNYYFRLEAFDPVCLIHHYYKNLNAFKDCNVELWIKEFSSKREQQLRVLMAIFSQ